MIYQIISSSKCAWIKFIWNVCSVQLKGESWNLELDIEFEFELDFELDFELQFFFSTRKNKNSEHREKRLKNGSFQWGIYGNLILTHCVTKHRGMLKAVLSAKSVIFVARVSVFQCFVFQSESDTVSNRLCDCFVENNDIREWIRREVMLMSSLEVASSSFYVPFFMAIWKFSTTTLVIFD